MSKTSEKSNIHIITSLGMGGAETSLYNCLMESTSVNVVVNLSSPGVYSEKLREQGVVVHDLSLNTTGLWNGFLSSRRLLRDLARDNSIDVFCWMYHSLLIFFFAFPFARKCTWLIRHGSFLKNLPVKKLILSLFLIPVAHLKCNKIIYNSWFAKHSHERFLLPKKNSEVIANFTPPDRYAFSEKERNDIRKKMGLNNCETVYGCFARFHDDKGQDRLLSSWKSVKPDLKNVLVLQGYGCVDGVTKFFGGSKKVPKNVMVFDSHFAPAEFYSLIDVYVLPSRTESYPNSLAEAYLSGCECITADVGDARYVVESDSMVLSAENFSEQLGALIIDGNKFGENSVAKRNERVVRRRKFTNVRSNLIDLGIDR